MGDECVDGQLGGDGVMHGFEGGADGFFAAEIGFADDLPVDVVGEVGEDGLDVGVGKGDVEVAEDAFLGGIGAVGVDGEFGHMVLSFCSVISTSG